MRLKMNCIRAWLAAAALLSPAAQAAAQDSGDTSKTVYCWMESGRKICGDALPVSAVDNPRTEISVASGLPTRTLERAPTDAERAAAEAQAAIDLEAARVAAAKLRRDMAMVESYASEADLRRAFQHRTVLLDEAIKTSQMGVSGLRQSLVVLLRRAGQAELAGKPVPQRLAISIGNQRQSLTQLQALHAQQVRERAAMDRELASALQRYRALKKPEAMHEG